MTTDHTDAGLTESVRESAVWGWNHESEIIAGLRVQLAESAARRDRHIRTLHQTNLSYRHIAALLGISPARIGQILTRDTNRTTTTGMTEGT